MHRILFIFTITVFCLFPTADAQADSATDFVKQYVTQVNEDTSHADFSPYWYAYARSALHDTPEGLQKEFEQAVNIHKIVVEDKTLSNTPEINAWGDDSQTTSFTYPMNTPVKNEVMQQLFEVPPTDETVWGQYQITIEQEDGKWVVSGESFIGQ